jgi:hypothetical protein
VYDGSLGGGRFYKTSDDRNLGPNGILTGSPEVVSSIEAGDWPCQDTETTGRRRTHRELRGGRTGSNRSPSTWAPPT